MMNIRSIKYHLKEGVKSLFKNRRMTIASIAAVATCTTMLIVSLCIAINLDLTLEKFEKNVGVSIYLGESVTSEQVREIYEQLEKINNISNISYMSKEDALDWAKQEWGNENPILEGLEQDNPFPRSFEIEVDSAKNQDSVISSIEKIQKDFEIKHLMEKQVSQLDLDKSLSPVNLDEEENANANANEEENNSTKMYNEVTKKIEAKDYVYEGIEKIKHSKKEANILLSISTTIRIISLFLILLFAIISVIIIINTIKITVYVRREEINIMKYVGATNSFIRWPFIVEGILIGLIGALIPSLICFFVYDNINNILQKNLSIFMQYIDFKPAFELFLVITPFSLLLGVLLGIIGSVNSIKKHLDV